MAEGIIRCRCIYCGEHKPPSDEHYLPECVGKFLNYECLDDRICRDCNNRIGRQLEDHFCHGGEVGFLRYRFGVHGKKSHKKKVNIFKRGSSGASRMEMTGKIPDREEEARLEVIKGTGTVEYMTQIIITTDKDEKHYIIVTDDMTEPEQLEEKMRELGIEKIKHVSMIGLETDSERLGKLVSTIPTKGETDWERLPMTGSTYTWTRFEVNTKYFRAIAKIAFHYMLKHFPAFWGDEEIFDDIRNFIMNGGDREKFVTWSEDQVIETVKQGYTLGAYCHILIAKATNKAISCNLQFFLGPGSVPHVYTVKIANNDSPLHYTIVAGHQFCLYPEGRKEGFDGEMDALVKVEMPPGE